MENRTNADFSPDLSGFYGPKRDDEHPRHLGIPPPSRVITFHTIHPAGGWQILVADQKERGSCGRFSASLSRFPLGL